MQRAKHQVTCFSRRECELDRFQVTQFADENGIGIFTQGRAERIVETVCVSVNLPLVDKALFTRVYKLDGVLNCENMAVLRFVLIIDHRRQCRGFTGAGRAGH